MRFVTRRMLRHWLFTTKLVDVATKELILARLILMGNGRGDNDVFSVDNDVVKILVDGYDELEQEAMSRDWKSDAKSEDYQAIDYFQRHKQPAPSAELA